MKRLLSFCVVLFISLTTSLSAQSTDTQSTAYSMGYNVGVFLGHAWPFIALCTVVFILYKLVKKRKTTA
jgi:hypothetical protein